MAFPGKAVAGNVMVFTNVPFAATNTPVTVWVTSKKSMGMV
jgi:hypothetical protein